MESVACVEPLSEDDARTYGIKYGLFFTENMFRTSHRDIRPLAVYFDPAHNEDYYHGMQSGGQYIFKPQAFPTEDCSAFGILPAEITTKIFMLAIQNDYATQHMLSAVVDKNHHLSKFAPTIRFYHNMESVSALETRIASTMNVKHLVLDKLHDTFTMPFLLLSDALLQGYATLFHWLISTNYSNCRILLSAMVDVVSGNKQSNCLPLSCVQHVEPVKRYTPLVYEILYSLWIILVYIDIDIDMSGEEETLIYIYIYLGRRSSWNSLIRLQKSSLIHSRQWQ